VQDGNAVVFPTPYKLAKNWRNVGKIGQFF